MLPCFSLEEGVATELVRDRCSFGSGGSTGGKVEVPGDAVEVLHAAPEAESWLLTTTRALGAHLVMAAPVASPKIQLRTKATKGATAPGRGPRSEPPGR